MKFAVVWRYKSDDSGDRMVTAHPSSFGETENEAKERARAIMPEVKKVSIVPVSVVEMHDTDVDKIYDLPEHYLGDDESLFFDLGELDQWKNESWWVQPTN